jgi:hypothetical protein
MEQQRDERSPLIQSLDHRGCVQYQGALESRNARLQAIGTEKTAGAPSGKGATELTLACRWRLRISCCGALIELPPSNKRKADLELSPSPSLPLGATQIATQLVGTRWD